MKKIKNKKKQTWNKERLIALGIPAVLIPGLLVAFALGWNPQQLTKTNDYHAIKTVFPNVGTVASITDGDTFTLQNGTEVRLLGIDAPNRGEEGFAASKEYVASLTSNQRVYLEYDRYQDDKYGRVLAWVWVGCEKKPTFLPADYMHLSGNASKEGLRDNPEGCKEGALVNEEMIRKGWAMIVTYKDRGPLKYEERLRK